MKRLEHLEHAEAPVSSYYPIVPIDAALVQRLYDGVDAGRWRVPVAVFASALAGSVAHAFKNRPASAHETERYLRALRLDDLALACACAAGDERAWEQFINEHRPALYRAADAIDPSGGARDLADALYADLYGLRQRDGERQSLFRYYHGRSSLSTWLRAVLAQRHVDRLRADRRLDALPDDESPSAMAAPVETVDPHRARLREWIMAALAWVVAALAPRDRLRLNGYYAQSLTLAQIGRLLGEHEATVSRHLTRTRREIRERVEARLREAHHLDAAGVAQCFAAVADDPGALDVSELLALDGARKNAELERSRS